jgi:hypothetical protein
LLPSSAKTPPNQPGSIFGGVLHSRLYQKAQRLDCRSIHFCCRTRGVHLEEDLFIRSPLVRASSLFKSSDGRSNLRPASTRSHWEPPLASTALLSITSVLIIISFFLMESALASGAPRDSRNGLILRIGFPPQHGRTVAATWQGERWLAPPHRSAKFRATGNLVSRPIIANCRRIVRPSKLPDQSLKGHDKNEEKGKPAD